MAVLIDAGRWVRIGRFNQQAVRLADEHYSRRSPGTPQFMPPGRVLTFLTGDGSAVWGSHWPRAEYVLDGLDAWRCTIYRNCGPELSSSLIPEAMALTAEAWGAPPPAGWLTYVDRRKVRSANPGYCFKMAGWEYDHTYVHRHLIRLRATADKST